MIRGFRGDRIEGPRGSIPFTRDVAGYPSIHARDELDGVYARAFLHAVDRQGQALIARRIAQGRAMELLGDEPFTRALDSSSRALGLAADLGSQVAQMRPENRRWLQTYCDGFNAGLAATRPPVTLLALGLRREPWRVRDIVLMYRLVAWFGMTSSAHAGRLLVTRLLADGVPLERLQVLLGPGADGLDAESLRGLRMPLGAGIPGAPLHGSNAFAVGGARTPSGSALLVGEFHGEIGTWPPAAYAFHVEHEHGPPHTGVSIPGLPFVSAGRSDRVAWSYTTGHADHLEVTVERLDRGRRLDTNGWEPLRIREERVRAGRRTEVWRYGDFEGGTVLEPDGDGLRVALRWRGLSTSGQDFDAFHDGLHARTAGELAATHAAVTTIGTCGVFADADGTVVGVHSGRVRATRAGWGPRAGWEPDPGDAPRPWMHGDQVVSANQAFPGWTAFPEPPYRARRLTERLAARPIWDADALARLSYDPCDPLADRFRRAWSMPGLTDAAAHALHRRAARALLARELGPVAHTFVDDLDLLVLLQDHLDPVLALEQPERLDRAGLDALIEASPVGGRGPYPDHVRFRHRLLGSLVGSERLRPSGGPTSAFQLRQGSILGRPYVGGPGFHLVIDLAVPGVRYNLAGGASERWGGPGFGVGAAGWACGELRTLPVRAEGGPARPARP